MSSIDNEPDDLRALLHEGYAAPPPEAAFSAELLGRLTDAMPPVRRARPLRLYWRAVAASIAAVVVIGFVISRWPGSTPPLKEKTIVRATQTRPLKRELKESLMLSTDLELESLQRSRSVGRALTVKSLDAAENQILSATTQAETLEEARAADPLERNPQASFMAQLRDAQLIVRARLLSRSPNGSRWHIDRVLKGVMKASQLEIPANATPPGEQLDHQAIFFLDRTQVKGDVLLGRVLCRLDEQQK